LYSKLESIYSTAKVCPIKNKSCNCSDPTQAKTCLSLDPELTQILKESRDYDELLYAWKGWHDVTGPKMREPFAKTVVINNKAARQNGYKDLSENWLEDYEDEGFESKMDKLFEEIQPLYLELHKYVKRKLDEKYGDKYPLSHDKNLIPAHLLG
jgi:peptidyl-dipeptidase A